MKKILLKILYNILALFTKLYILKTKPSVIGITGSVGKTSCRMIIFQVLQKYIKHEVIYTSPKNFNSELGLIFSIFKIEKFSPGIISLIKISFKIIFKALFDGKKYDTIILEYGVDHPGDMDFLLSIVKPDISIFTKLDTIHIENFSSKKHIGREKYKLIKSTKNKTFLNYGEKFLREKFSDINIKLDYYNHSDLNFEYIKEGEKIFSKLKIEDRLIKTNLLGKENSIYIELAFLILKDLGVSSFEVQEYLELNNQAGRFNIFDGLNNSKLIDSTYNAGLESMKIMIENTRILQKQVFKDYKLIFVIGDMRELGVFSREEHEKLYKEFNDDDILMSVGTETKKYFPANIINYNSAVKVGSHLKSILTEREEKFLVLFKGSQNTIFLEEALKQVLLYKEDEKKLVRQGENWIEKKKLFL